MADETGQVRLALSDIERLMKAAQASGAPVDGWVEQIADELRSVMPELDPEAAARLARRMLKHPGRSLRAQARLAPGALKVLAE